MIEDELSTYLIGTIWKHKRIEHWIGKIVGMTLHWNDATYEPVRILPRAIVAYEIMYNDDKLTRVSLPIDILTNSHIQIKE